MILVQPSFEIIPQEESPKGIYRMIETAGRICTHAKSGNEPEKFVDMLIRMKHLSPLEHGTVYLTVPEKVFKAYSVPYTKMSVVSNGIYRLITINYRALLQSGWLDAAVPYITEPHKQHDRRLAVRFTLSRAIAQEFTRHRAFSFSMESQRYCNYTGERFGRQIAYVLPYWCSAKAGEYKTLTDVEKAVLPPPDTTFLAALRKAEISYNDLIRLGMIAQEAREVLPNACKTELMMTGFEKDWKDFFRQRASWAEYGKPHPDASKLAEALLQELQKQSDKWDI